MTVQTSKVLLWRLKEKQVQFELVFSFYNRANKFRKFFKVKSVAKCFNSYYNYCV